MTLDWLKELVTTPNAWSINTYTGACPTALIQRRRGLPRAWLTDKCLPPTDAWWRSRMVSADVGPFRVTGFKPAVEMLRRSLAKVRDRKPVLYGALSSAGMLCVRHVRGVPGLASNHAFGMAIDFKVGGVLDPYGDGTTQRGLIELYSVMKADGWYWGAGFRKEDSMHFEVGEQVVRSWILDGLL